MLFLALPSQMANALLIAYLLFVAYIAFLMYKRFKNGRGSEILPLIGLGILPIVLFTLLIAFA